eukprot:CAMPEP_0179614188 /NCGR_PEP_ID=MMETSP0930-20121108/5431_1 /TAXON_ID=548131 ORGANISM="Ostreococcus mediterraneus, Strain clade-D-RCC1621" /NCGR_SAMPLE_ID=MMETSP0930 /ASSEMBLY_ACC=CAM_ASM_000580 /LENGTH=130 /DNA_ID=CAMNT_0021482887 /DNA_START=259 /DNA_END=647 /DNA_ORIENTATION=+
MYRSALEPTNARTSRLRSKDASCAGKSSEPYTVCPYPATSTASGTSQDSNVDATRRKCASKLSRTCPILPAPTARHAHSNASELVRALNTSSSWSSASEQPQRQPSLSRASTLHAHVHPNANHAMRARAP